MEAGAAPQRLSSPAAESRSEERAQAVGGRVQRLVRRLLRNFNPVMFALNTKRELEDFERTTRVRQSRPMR